MYLTSLKQLPANGPLRREELLQFRALEIIRSQVLGK